jgi:D-arabinose 1-dehydrogenase-like Zn-dependent alcohol dehydrogenase
MTKPKTMRAMVLEEPGQPLKWLEVPAPQPGPEQVLLRVHACGVCRYCRGGRENLCDHPGFTGYTLDGGYAEYAGARSRGRRCWWWGKSKT